MDLLARLLDEHVVADVAIVSYEVPPPLEPNPWHPFVLFPSSSPKHGHDLAIPQKALYRAYAEACRRLRDPGLAATTVLLLQNPDHSTALNLRRQRVSPNIQGWLDELGFARMVLSVPQNAKAASMWHHRRWLLARLFPSSRRTPFGPAAELTEAATTEELRLVGRCVDVYPRNYYAWMHRRWVVSCLVGDRRDQVVEREAADVRDHLLRNPRDHSAAEYLAFLVDAGRLESTVAELVHRFPSFETTWLLSRRVPSSPDNKELKGRVLEARENWDGKDGTLAAKEVADAERAVVLATRAADWKRVKRKEATLDRGMIVQSGDDATRDAT